MGRKSERRRVYQKSGLERIVGGIGFTAVAAALFAFHIAGPWIIPVGIVFGVLPILSGARRTVREIEDRRAAKAEALEDRQAQEAERRDSLEKTVLRVAKDRKGVVSPAVVALQSDLELAEAEKVLEGLAARGYAEMRVKENGTIDFVFHDLK